MMLKRPWSPPRPVPRRPEANRRRRMATPGAPPGRGKPEGRPCWGRAGRSLPRTAAAGNRSLGRRGGRGPAPARCTAAPFTLPTRRRPPQRPGGQRRAGTDWTGTGAGATPDRRGPDVVPSWRKAAAGGQAEGGARRRQDRRRGATGRFPAGGRSRKGGIALYGPLRASQARFAPDRTGRMAQGRQESPLQARIRAGPGRNRGLSGNPEAALRGGHPAQWRGRPESTCTKPG